MTSIGEHSNVSPESKSSNKLVISVDSQVLSKIQTCGQQAAYAHIENIEPRDYESTSLDIGLVMHEGLAEYYRNKYKVPTNIALAKSLAKIETSAITKPSLNRSAITMMVDAMSQYVRKYELEQWIPVRDTNGNPLVEQTFAKLLYEDEDIRILYVGITDLIVQAAENIKLMLPVDHKTFGGYYKPAVLSNQFSGYIWATGVTNLIVNRVGVSQKLGNFERVVVGRTANQIEEWKRNAIRAILGHLDDIRSKDFRRNYEACTLYGGCRYARLCGSDPTHRKYLIGSEYKSVEPWNPLEARD